MEINHCRLSLTDWDSRVWTLDLQTSLKLSRRHEGMTSYEQNVATICKCVYWTHWQNCSFVRANSVSWYIWKCACKSWFHTRLKMVTYLCSFLLCRFRNLSVNTKDLGPPNIQTKWIMSTFSSQGRPTELKVFNRSFTSTNCHDKSFFLPDKYCGWKEFPPTLKWHTGKSFRWRIQPHKSQHNFFICLNVICLCIYLP